MYTNLGFKTDYSLLKSLIKLDTLIEFAKKNNFTSLGILDNTLCSSHMFIEACKKNNIKGVIGLDIIIDNIRVYLYPTNIDGLVSLFKLEKYRLDNEVSFKSLRSLKNLICVIPYDSISNYELIINTFNDVYASFSNEFELKNINKITNKTLFIREILCFTKEQSKYINYLNMIADNKKLGEYEFIDYSNNSYIENKYDNSEFINKINIEFKTSGNHIPTFNKEIEDSGEYLNDLATKGLSRRLNGNVTEEYKNRLKYELDIISKMGFIDYFLIVFDYVRFALKNDIIVGCGRGSAVGSLVAYALGITWIDPLKYNLLFERFLNPERVTMPDIDIDFQDNRRDEVVDYVINKYGENKVSHIMTYGTLTAKEVIRTVGKIDLVDEGAINALSNLLDSKLSLKQNLNDEVKQLIKRNSSLRKIYEEAYYLEGLKNQIGTHAAGIVISEDDLTNTIPVIRSGNVYLSGYQKDELEALGLLKMDFLSVADLTVMKNTVDLIKKYKGIDININSIPLDEKRVYDLLSSGNTTGIFQFKTPMMKKYLKEAKPTEFKDLIMALAINRPGPMNNIPEYIERKNKGKKIDYLLPELEPILGETYGIMIYQEQVMQVLRTLAGYSYGEADVIRRAISKKKLELIQNEKTRFITNAINNGFDKVIVEKIYDQIVEFADYGFNKSHSVAYSFVAYQMSYLKALYPEYFYLALLNDGGRKELIINEAKQNGIKIVKADINVSDIDYVFKDDAIVLSFKSIKGITESISKIIIDARGNESFTDIYDFFGRVKGINKKILISLMEAGVFDSFNVNRATLVRNVESLITYGDLIQTLSKDLVSEPELIEVEEYSDIDLMKKELDLFGFYVSSHPCSKYNCFKQIDIKKNFDKTIEMYVLINRIKCLKTKKNDDMAFIDYEDETGVGDGVVFSDAFNYLNDINEGDIVKVIGHVERRNDKFQLVVKKIEKVS